MEEPIKKLSIEKSKLKRTKQNMIEEDNKTSGFFINYLKSGMRKFLTNFLNLFRKNKNQTYNTPIIIDKKDTKKIVKFVINPYENNTIHTCSIERDEYDPITKKYRVSKQHGLDEIEKYAKEKNLISEDKKLEYQHKEIYDKYKYLTKNGFYEKKSVVNKRYIANDLCSSIKPK